MKASFMRIAGQDVHTRAVCDVYVEQSVCTDVFVECVRAQTTVRASLWRQGSTICTTTENNILRRNK